jgi:hypothetical protein
MNSLGKAALAAVTAANTFLAVTCAYFATSVLRNSGARSGPAALLWLMAFCVFLVWTGHMAALIGAYRRRTSDSFKLAHTLGVQATPALLGLMAAFLILHGRF